MYTDDRGQRYSDDELERLGGCRARVLKLMMDGQWHTNRDFIKIGGNDGPRRAREIRKAPWCGPLPVEARVRKGEGSTKEYRLDLDKANPVWIDRILRGDVRAPGRKGQTKTCPHCNGTGKVPADYLPPPRANEIDALLDAEDDDEDEIGGLLDLVTTDW